MISLNDKLRVAIVSHIGIEAGGLNFLFPLFNAKIKLKAKGVDFKIFNNHNDKEIDNFDIVIIIHRYFHIKFGTTNIKDYSPIIEYIEYWKHKGKKVIYFDAGDSTGSREFKVIEHVDAFWKKQVLVDKNQYLLNRGNKSVRVWIDDDVIDNDYFPCPASQLYKIKVAWNIGLCDYRFTYFNFGFLTNRVFGSPSLDNVNKERIYSTVFRGTINYNNSVSFQRSKSLQIMQSLDLGRVQLGGRVNKFKYRNELANSKVIISPFGWGEVCYRDFEAVIAGGILLKPDMEHLETYPNFYIKNENYISIDWNLDNFENILQDTLGNYEEKKIIAQNAQSAFKLFHSTEDFANHFINILTQ